jgi:predicted nucleotidyltransferase
MKTQTKLLKTQKPLLNFAASRFLIRDQVLIEIRKAIQRIRSQDIQAVYLFGSFASGVPTPKSDVDLLVVAEKINWEDLQTELLSVPVPVDCHLVSPDAFEQLSKSGKGVVGAAINSGIRLI